jgi:hypothetical protein
MKKHSIDNRWTVLVTLAALALASAPTLAQRAPNAPDAGAADASASQVAPLPPGAREVEVVVDNRYTPDVIEAFEGERLRLRFVRRDYSPCSREVVFSTFGIRRMLPTNQPVVIDLPALTVGEHPFQCWMNMLRGRIVVRARPAVATPSAQDAGVSRDAGRPRAARPVRR